MVKMSTDRRIGVFAQSEYGKTWLVKDMIKFLCSRGDRVIVYDTDFNDIKYKFSDINNCYVWKPDLELGENPSYLNRFISNLREKNSDFWLFIDDIDVFFDKATALSFDFAELKNTASKGRHQRIGLIYTSKIATHIPTQLLLNTNLFYIGAFPSKTALKPLSEIVDIQEILKLDYTKHQFLEIDAKNNYAKRLIQ